MFPKRDTVLPGGTKVLLKRDTVLPGGIKVFLNRDTVQPGEIMVVQIGIEVLEEDTIFHRIELVQEGSREVHTGNTVLDK